jgi:hypothetical protein
VGWAVVERVPKTAPEAGVFCHLFTGARITAFESLKRAPPEDTVLTLGQSSGKSSSLNMLFANMTEYYRFSIVTKSVTPEKYRHPRESPRTRAENLLARKKITDQVLSTIGARGFLMSHLVSLRSLLIEV